MCFPKKTLPYTNNMPPVSSLLQNAVALHRIGGRGGGIVVADGVVWHVRTRPDRTIRRGDMLRALRSVDPGATRVEEDPPNWLPVAERWILPNGPSLDEIHRALRQRLLGASLRQTTMVLGVTYNNATGLIYHVTPLHDRTPSPRHRRTRSRIPA